MSTTNEAKRPTLQESCELIINWFNIEQQDIYIALQNYQYILTHYKNNSLYTQQERHFIFNQFLKRSFKALMTRQHEHFRDDYNMADLIQNCCKLLMEIAVPLIKDNHPLAFEIIYFCMNPSNPFFTNFGHDWRECRGEELKLEQVKENEEWRSSELKVGCHIDYLLHNRWRYGEITKITDKQYDDGTKYQLFNIQPKMNGICPDDGIFNDEWVLIPKQTTSQISKPLTKSLEKLPYMIQWRRILGRTDDENNNLCDVLNLEDDKWYNCMIIESDPSANRIKMKYDGISPELNEWIYRDDRRLQQYNHENDDFYQAVEDDEDPNDDNLYAIYRGRYGEISYHLVNVINEFGKHGGFEAISQILCNPSAISINCLSIILLSFSKCWKIYTKSFADRWLVKMYNLMINTLKSLTQKQCDALTSRECERIICCIDNYLRRYHSEEVIKKIVKKWRLELLLRRLQCQKEEDAAEEVAKICAATNRETDIRMNIGVDELMNWIEENNIFQYIFGCTNVILFKSDVLIEGYTRENYENYQCISVDITNLIKLWYDEHSVKIIEFISRESKLTRIHIEMIWNTLISITLHNKSDGLTVFHVVHKLYDIIGPMIMKKCINNLIGYNYIIPTIRTLIGILSLTDKDMRYTIIGHMIDNEKLLKHYCDEIVYFKNNVAHYIQTKNIKECNINQMKIFNEKLNYLQNVTERIDFLDFISTNYTHFKLEHNERDILYTHFIQNALTEEERKISIMSQNDCDLKEISRLFCMKCNQWMVYSSFGWRKHLKWKQCDICNAKNYLIDIQTYKKLKHRNKGHRILCLDIVGKSYMNITNKYERSRIYIKNKYEENFECNQILMDYHHKFSNYGAYKKREKKRK